MIAQAIVVAAEPANPRFTGTPFMRTWVAEDYGAAPGNQCVLQNPRNGFIYIGNNIGILEYDSVRWRLIRVPNRTIVRTLAVDGRGRVWAANDDTISCLVPDEHGVLRARAAMDRLPADERAFRGAFASLSAPDGVFIAAAQRLFFFGDDDGPARVWRIPDEALPLQMWQANGAPHVQFISGRILRLRDGQIARETAEIAAGALALVRPRADEGALCAASLADGRVALGTALEGLVIQDRDGRKVQQIDRTRGLPSNRVEGLCEDREGGVWLALRNGLARIQLDSPHALHGPAQRFDGTPTHLELFRREVYVSSAEGLTRRDADGRFHALENLLHVARDLVVHHDRLYITGRDLQVVLPGDRVGMIDARNYNGFVPLSSAPGTFVHGAPNGLWLVRAAGDKWTRLGRCEKISGPTTVLMEEPKGIVWAIAPSTGLWRVDFRGGARLDAAARNYGPADGLPAALSENNARFFRLGGGLDLIARGKIFRFDEATGRFAPETRISGLSTAAQAVPGDNGEAAPSDAAAFARTAADGTVWLQLAAPTRRIVQLVPNSGDLSSAGSAKAETWRAEPLPGPTLRRLSTTVLLPDAASRTLWIGGSGYLLSQDLEWRPTREPAPVVAALRRMESSDGTVIWADGGNTASLSLSPSLPLSLPPSRRALRFVFASPTFATDHAGRMHTQFRTRLDGLDPAWTNWSGSTQREFTNLPFRDFTFRVQARDDDGRTSAETTFGFAILPPWWLTNWALAMEVLIAIALVAAVARHFAHRALRQRVQLLEAEAAVEAERLRLARDMHDDLGSGLGRVALLGSSALAKLDDRAAVETSFRKIAETAQALSRATREIIWAVTPHHDTVPELVEHLAQLAEETLGEAGIQCTTGFAPDLPAVAFGAAVRHAVLLAVKEALHNAVKYSGATTAEFSVTVVDAALVLTLRDHGRGFAPGECQGTGHGVKSIVARLAAVGGSGEVIGTPGEGTIVRLKLPLPQA